MGASRKLQGEIDRVLKKVQEGVELFDSIWNKVYDTDNANQKEKYEADLKKEIKKLQRYRDQIKTWIQSSEIKDKKVSASYEQALIDARKQIEREMERFKICEKETKTKAFSKEGLGQQPKTDPKEKAKSETRDWINTVVGELESQVDTFEAEMEGLSVKKGKTRPPRLVHLETSITRHKSHVMKLELILRLLDNDELSPEQVNEVKDFLDDYLERNQEDFDEFSDVDELYSSLPLVDTLEDLVTIGPPGHAKGMKPQGGSGGSSILTLKTGSSSHTPAVATSPHKSVPVVEQNEEVSALDSTFDVPPRTPPSKSNVVSSSNLVTTIASHTSTGPVNIPQSGVSTSSTVTSTISSRGAPEISVPTASSSLNPTIVSKEEEVSNVPVRRPSPVVVETGLARGMGRSGITSQPAANNILGSAPPVSSGAMTLGTAPLASDVAKRNILGADEKLASSVVSGRAFSPSVSPGMQWRPGSTFQNQSETGQFRGRVEIAPDQREKFLQRLQEVRQQGHSNILGMSTIGGNHKQFPGQPLQQLNSQSSSVTSQVGHSLGIHPPGLNTPTSSALQQQTSVLQQQPSALQQQPSPIVQQATQQGSLLTGVKDADGGLAVDEQQQQVLSDESNTENNSGSGLSKNLMTDGDSKAIYSSKDAPAGGVSSSMVESSQLQRDVDLSPGQPLRPSGSLGVIGQRSVSDLGAIGDNLGATSSNYGVVRDQMYNYRMLEASYNKMPLPKDSERTKSYNPRHPAVTPASYPQVQVPFVNNPAFWERMAFDPVNADTLFFAFYFQPNTYQQFLAAKELKKQAWRYHRKYHTWFQRHKEPDDATDEYEKGSYVYFDCHVNEDEQGWCQRLKHDFVFEYSYLEDELIV